MKHLFLLLLCLSTTTCFSQNWKEYIIDSNLALTLPENYTVTDTMDQKVIMAKLDGGLVMVTHMENNGQYEISVTDEPDLVLEYKSFRKGMLKSARGKLIQEGAIVLNGLKTWKFSFSARWGEEKQTRYCQVLFLNKRIYVIHFWERVDKSAEMAPLREKLFSSLVLPSNLSLANQLNLIDDETAAKRLGEKIGNLIFKLLIASALIFLFVFIVRKNKDTVK